MLAINLMQIKIIIKEKHLTIILAMMTSATLVVMTLVLLVYNNIGKGKGNRKTNDAFLIDFV